MIIATHPNRQAGQRQHRRGISLIEVIACTALVAIMIVPIAGVIRASTQSIASAEGDTSTHGKLRVGLRWLQDTIRESDVLAVGGRQLGLRLSDGRIVTIRVQAGNLVLIDGVNQTILVEAVRDIRFTSLRRITPPRNRVGISMTLRARDLVTLQWVSVTATTAETPQV